jgi:ABC-type Fe3+/spermidine/putrescine transport system ATPase subunit
VAAVAEQLVVTEATKEFGPKRALDGVDLNVPEESLCVLLGPSGSGKTTLLRCIAGIERLSTGRIAIGERAVAGAGRHEPPERRRLAMVFQDYALWPHLTAARNVEFALGRQRRGRGEARRRSRDMLERVGLGDLAERYPSELSGGEQQRVALARALAARTDLLLFDEPLSNLDADLRERMRLEIATLVRAARTTSVYITHDQAEAFALADRIGVMRLGRLVQYDTPENVYRHPASPFVARFTGLAGELPVTVTGTDEGQAALRAEAAGADGAKLFGALPSDRPARDAVGADASLLVRPAAIELLAPDGADHHFNAVVLDAAFRGRGYDHALLLADGSRLVAAHDTRRWPPGSNVGVRLRPDGCLVFGTSDPHPETLTPTERSTPPMSDITTGITP